MDQIAARKWVQRNIAAFGGDPANVTIIDESAGGRSVNTLITLPMTQGLFAKAVIMSGGDGHNANSSTLADVEKIGLKLAEGKGIAAHDPEALTKLRALSADAVTDGLNLEMLFKPLRAGTSRRTSTTSRRKCSTVPPSSGAASR